MFGETVDQNRGRTMAEREAGADHGSSELRRVVNDIVDERISHSIIATIKERQADIDLLIDARVKQAWPMLLVLNSYINKLTLGVIAIAFLGLVALFWYVAPIA